MEGLKWYHLKKQVVSYIASQNNPDYLDDLKQISRRNAWGNYFALTATASFLQKDICVFTTQAIINISVAGSKGTVNLALCNFHYSLMQNRSAAFVGAQCKDQFPQTMQQYLQQQSNLPHCIAHQQVYAQKNGSENNYKYTKIEQQKAKILHQQLADMVAASRLPAYRPAGTPSGQRRPGENFHDQVQRVAKARLAVPGGQMNVPKATAEAIGGRLTPTQPAGPPPDHLRRPAEPKGPSPPSVLRAAIPGIPATFKKKTMPRPPMPRPSSAPGLLDDSGRTASSSSAELPKAAPATVEMQPKAAGPPQFNLKELLIVSRGTRPECVQVTSNPRELQDPAWDIILKSLHKLDNPQRDKTLQAHVGINGRVILQLVRYEPMRTAVLKAAKQALHSRKAAIIFECSQGRRRSVAAAGILYQLLQRLVSRIKLTHASRDNWWSTCGGNCPECKRGPPQQFHDEIDLLRSELLAQIARDYIVPCMPATVCNAQLVPCYETFLDQVPTFRCQAFQQSLGSLLADLSFGSLHMYCLEGGFACRHIFRDMTDMVQLRHENHMQQKPKQSKNLVQNCSAKITSPKFCNNTQSKSYLHLENYCKIVSSGIQEVTQALTEFLKSVKQIASYLRCNSHEQPRKQRDEHPGDYTPGRQLHVAAFGACNIGCIVTMPLTWLITYGSCSTLQTFSVACMIGGVSERATVYASCLDQDTAFLRVKVFPAFPVIASYATGDHCIHVKKIAKQKMLIAQKLTFLQKQPVVAVSPWLLPLSYRRTAQRARGRGKGGPMNRSKSRFSGNKGQDECSSFEQWPGCAS